MSKRQIFPRNFQDVYNFVETYPYWAILDNGTVIFSSENGKSIQDALPDALEIAKKRHKIEVIIRAGSNEPNSRTNDEYVIRVQSVNDGEITQVYLQSQEPQAVYLNGQNPQFRNPAGLSAQDIQAYLNGAIDRTKDEMRLYTDNKNLEKDVEWAKKMADQEIAFKRELFQREIEAERERLDRERQEFEERKSQIEQEYEMTNQGLAGIFKSVASVGNELMGKNSLWGKSKKLDGKTESDYEKPSSRIADMDDGFEDANHQESEEQDDFDPILDGFDNLSDEEIGFLQELIQERKEKSTNNSNQSETKKEDNNEDISSENND